MKIALPLTAANEFASHYGAAAQFVVYDIEPNTHAVRRRLQVRPAGKRPCQWPVLLRSAGAELMLVGGMGQGARERMAEHGIEVRTGVPAADPEVLVAGWLAGTLSPGANACDGSHGGAPHAHGADGEHGHEGGCGCSH